MPTFQSSLHSCGHSRIACDRELHELAGLLALYIGSDNRINLLAKMDGPFETVDHEAAATLTRLEAR